MTMTVLKIFTGVTFLVIWLQSATVNASNHNVVIHNHAFDGVRLSLWYEGIQEKSIVISDSYNNSETSHATPMPEELERAMEKYLLAQ